MAEDTKQQASVIDLLDDAITNNELETGISSQFISQYKSAISIYRRKGVQDAFEFMIGCGLYSFCGINPQEVPSFPEAAVFAFEGIKPNIDARKARHKKNIADGKKGGNPNFKKGQPNPYYPSRKDNPYITPDNPYITPDNLKEEISNNEEEIRSNNEEEIRSNNEEVEKYYFSLSSNNAFLESVAAKYPELKADGVRAMLTQFLEWCKTDNKSHKSLNDFQDHFTRWLTKQNPMTREQTQRYLSARAENERQAEEREKQYDEAAKNAMPHDAAMNDPRYIEKMAMLEAEG